MSVVFAGLLATASLLAAPAHADPSTDAFLNAVTSAGLGGTTDPTTTGMSGNGSSPSRWAVR